MKLAEHLKAAREALKLTLQAVSDRTEIGLSTLSEFENGKREPRLWQLNALAKLYQRSVASFLDEQAPARPAVLWRKRPAAQFEEIQAMLLNFAEQYHNLEVLCDDQATLRLPVIDEVVGTFGIVDATKLAIQTGKDLGLGDRPGLSLFRVLDEVCNVKIFHLDFEPARSAASTVSPTFGAAVLLNAGNPSWSRSFELAHELFHLLTWKVFKHDQQCNLDAPDPVEEDLANHFARCLLMPLSAFREAVDSHLKRSKSLTFDHLLEVARVFDVPVEAVFRHLPFVYEGSAESARAALQIFRQHNTFTDVREGEKPRRLPYRFEALAKQALRKGLISTGVYMDYVGVTRKEAMRVASEDSLDDVQVEIGHP